MWCKLSEAATLFSLDFGGQFSYVQDAIEKAYALANKANVFGKLTSKKRCKRCVFHLPRSLQ